ncbi:DNA-directed DNA polymerase alpha subunit pol12 [Blastocladiella emersonii ATCC 22665]|nr:DNA-directed DNA polymerase alpha subunit pol12 [Blastocladiella emersonii ATCC 22665]
MQSDVTTAVKVLETKLKRLLGPIPDALLGECAHICQMYQLTAEDFFNKWEAYAVNRSLDTLTSEHLDELRGSILAEFNRKAIAAAAAAPPSTPRPAPPATPATANRTGPRAVPVAATPVGPPVPMAPNRVVHNEASLTQLMAQMSQVPMTPGQSQGVPSTPATGRTGTKFADRQNKGKVEVTYNAHLASCATTNLHADAAKARRIALIDNQDIQPYKYMYDKVGELGEMMEDYLYVFEQRFREALPDVDEFTNPGYASQTTVFALGRLVLEDARKFAHDNLVFECARKFNGVRVKLVLDPALPFHSLFPGQVIVVEGTNPEGYAFHVQKIHHLPLPDPPTTRASALLAQPQKPHGLLVAAGPYTTSDNLDYAPLQELVHLIETHAPEAVVLLGPFVDDRHPLIQSGDVDLLPEDLFRHRVADPLARVAAAKACEIVLVLSPYDMVHPYCTFPQPAFPSSLLGTTAAGALTMLPNPVQFSWHELVVGVAARDTVLELAGAEWTTAAAPPPHVGTDRAMRAVRGVLEQRSFYPLFPPPESAPAVEYSQLGQLELQAAPDLVILPSQLRIAAKPLPLGEAGGTNLDDPVSLVVNPGHAARGVGGGTVAWITLHPFPPGTLSAVVAAAAADGGDEAGDFVYHAAHCRVRVDVVRL